MAQHHREPLDPNPPKPIHSIEDWERATGLKFDRKTPPKNEIKGLGDRVERIAQPIARVIDGLAGTNIQECGGCKKRKEWLNKHFPNTLTNMIQ